MTAQASKAKVEVGDELDAILVSRNSRQHIKTATKNDEKHLRTSSDKLLHLTFNPANKVLQVGKLSRNVAAGSVGGTGHSPVRSGSDGRSPRSLSKDKESKVAVRSKQAVSAMSGKSLAPQLPQPFNGFTSESQETYYFKMVDKSVKLVC